MTVPWTITLEVTMSGMDLQSEEEAQEVGEDILNYIVSGYDGAAGAVMRVEPSE